MSTARVDPAGASDGQTTDTGSTPLSPFAAGLLLWTLFAIPVLVTVNPIGTPFYDPDIWWHLSVGKWVVENRTVPTNDPFSQIGRDQAWVAYSWLYEVMVYLLYCAFGLGGIIIYRTVMAVAIIAAIYALVRRLEPRLFVAIVLTAAAVLALALLFSERPWLFTVLFTTLTLHAILTLRRPADGRPPGRPWSVWLLPVAYVLWANIHIQFIYGLFVLGLACVAPFADRWLGWREPEQSAAWPGTPAHRRLILLSAVCVLATLVNPYHVRIYGVVVEYATQPGPFRWVKELTALDFRAVSDWTMLALTLAAVYVLGRERPSAFEMALVLAGLSFAFRARRDVWFAVLADLVVLASAAARTAVVRPRAGNDAVPDYTRESLPMGARLAVIVGLIGTAAFTAWARDLIRPESLERRVAETFPRDACRFVQEKKYPGPLYNNFDWGGYLIWALPDLPVAIDGRTNLHGDERIERFGRMWDGLPRIPEKPDAPEKPGWPDGPGSQDDPDLSAAGVIIAPAETAMVSLLLRDSRFECVYSDRVARVFIPRRTNP